MRRRTFLAASAALSFAERAVAQDTFIRGEHKRWGEVIRAAGIQPQ